MAKCGNRHVVHIYANVSVHGTVIAIGHTFIECHRDADHVSLKVFDNRHEARLPNDAAENPGKLFRWEVCPDHQIPLDETL